MSRSHRRGPWVAEEDSTLLSLVASRGPNNWVQISQHMHYRSPKQCRERYHQNLKASLNHDPISADEGELIEQMVTDMGKKWAEIARRLGNRSDNAVKNWWNGSQNRRKRHVPHHGASSKTLNNRSQPLSVVKPSRSSAGHDVRLRKYGDPSARFSRAWQDLGPSDLGRRTLCSHQSQASYRAYRHEQSHSGVHSLQRFQGSTYHAQQEPERLSPPVLRESAPDDQNGRWLPSLRLINTSQPLPSSASHAMQPVNSANSTDRAPSLVSDHNSNYSISPKAWPSPRPEVAAALDTSRSHWHESPHIDRRGSAPTISSFVSLPFTGDEGYVSAIPPSVSSEPKYLLPTPVGRPESFDGHCHDNHRHSASNPSIRLPPMVERNNNVKDRSSARDTRMNFSSLLN